MGTDHNAELSPIAVGRQVRAVDSEPVFSSDPTSGDVGKVIEASPPSYLVHWNTGAETWMQRTKLEPLGREPEAMPAPVAATVRKGRSLYRYGALIVFTLVFAAQWIPALRDVARHPSGRAVALAGVVIVVIAVSLVFGWRQIPLDRQARADEQEAERERDTSGGTPAP